MKDILCKIHPPSSSDNLCNDPCYMNHARSNQSISHYHIKHHHWTYIHNFCVINSTVKFRLRWHSRMYEMISTFVHENISIKRKSCTQKRSFVRKPNFNNINAKPWQFLNDFHVKIFGDFQASDFISLVMWCVGNFDILLPES